MKKRSLHLIIILIANMACGQEFNLTVTGGFGTGIYNEGDTVHVWTKAIFSDSVFTQWSGSAVDHLTHSNEWHTTLYVPPGTGINNLELTADYDVIPEESQVGSSNYLLHGMDQGLEMDVQKETFYAIPPTPKAMLFLLHGTGGRGENFFLRYERYSLIKDLIYNGYAVFTLDANEVTVGDQNGDEKLRWDSTDPYNADVSNNVDVWNVSVLRDSVISEFMLPTDLPSYSLGMSAGAVFSDICASALGFVASAHITAKGSGFTYVRPDIAPVIWIMSDNDHQENADNATAFEHYTTMSGTQEAEWHLLQRSPLYSKRFLRSLNNILPWQSDSLFHRLNNAGYLTADSFLTYLVLDSIPLELLMSLGLNLDQMGDVRQQLLCVNADHVQHADYNKNIIRFFDQQLQALSVADEESELPSFNVYPNPFQGRLTIDRSSGSI
ncbi:MAG: hypothetical protein QF371_08185, partial [Flavobacteriales bacterium]|nr:hypothetical protein [Flavobacteriales bacterium]